MPTEKEPDLGYRVGGMYMVDHEALEAEAKRRDAANPDSYVAMPITLADMVIWEVHGPREPKPINAFQNRKVFGVCRLATIDPLRLDFEHATDLAAALNLGRKSLGG